MIYASTYGHLGNRAREVDPADVPAALDRTQWRMEENESKAHNWIQVGYVHKTLPLALWSGQWTIRDGSAEAQVEYWWVYYLRSLAMLHGMPDPFPPAPEPERPVVESKPAPTPYAAPVPVVEPPSAIRDDDDLQGCACNIAPPCDWCTTMTKEETDAWCQARHEGLRVLWDAWDAQGEE